MMSRFQSVLSERIGSSCVRSKNLSDDQQAHDYVAAWRVRNGVAYYQGRLLRVCVAVLTTTRGVGALRSTAQQLHWRAVFLSIHILRFHNV